MQRVSGMRLKDTVQQWLKKSLEDPVVKILVKNSHLTKTQLETLLIDILAENISGKPLKYEEKARLRLTKAKISRGAFNRTLKQAEENVIKAIYTVLLLGYLGIFETTSLDPYIEIANKLQEYIDAHKSRPNREEQLEEQIKFLKMLREELETSLKKLSNPSEGLS
jgi:ABC-type dipeptide/oligopeptide/nickel transport system ATPase component